MLKWRTGVVLAGLALALLMAASFRGQREPRYQGFSLSQWLHTSNCEYPEDFSVSHEAKEALRHIGTNAIPFLVRWISYEPSKLKTRLMPVLQRVPSLNRKFIHAPDYRADMAEIAFEILGTNAAPAIPELMQFALTPSYERRVVRCVHALSATGPEAFPAFLAIANTETWASAYSLPIFMKFGSNGVPVLLKSLTDKRDEVAEQAAMCLGELRISAETVIPALTNCLQSHSLSRRMGAVRGLGGFGSAAKAVVPQLQVVAVSDSWVAIRDEAAQALLKIAPEVLTNSNRENFPINH